MTDSTRQEVYDSLAMATDVQDAIDTVFSSGAVLGTFGYGGGHAFQVVTPHGHSFRVAVTEIPHEGFDHPACVFTGAPGESDDDCTTHDHERG